MAKALTIRSDKDLAYFLENIDNPNYLEGNPLKLGGTIIKLKLEGENLNLPCPGA